MLQNARAVMEPAKIRQIQMRICHVIELLASASWLNLKKLQNNNKECKSILIIC